MRCAGKRVAFCSRPLRVAVTTTRPLPESGLMNSPLALAKLKTTTRRAARSPMRLPYSAAEMSGPTRLNLACAPSNVPWPMKKTKTALSGPAAVFKAPKARRSSSAVARVARPSSGDSVRTVTLASSKPKRSTSARRRSAVHCANRLAKVSSPLAQLTMTANLFGSAGGRAAVWARAALAARQPQTSTPMRRRHITFTSSSRQSMPLAQEPLRAHHPDEQEEVDRHVPQVFGDRPRVVGVPVRQVFHEPASLFERVVFAA